MFVLLSNEEALVAKAVAERLEPGPLESLAERVSAFFAQSDSGPYAGLLVGMIPFDPSRHDHLFAPVQIARNAVAGFGTIAADLPAIADVRQVPPASEFAHMVERALAVLGTGPGSELRKVVLARGLEVKFREPIDPMDVVARLAGDRSVTTFAVDVAEPGAEPAAMVGATPELLLKKRGIAVRSHPLAGSSKRSMDRAADAEAGARLLRSSKDRSEHGIVVEYILDALSPFCRQLSASEPALRSTATMWHLGTEIAGTLKDAGTTSAELLTRLHPTPAVGGMPLARALDVIGDLEPFDRGFYAGAVGWTDASGDGAWHVVLRSALIAGETVSLHAGAGIVPGSDPAAELAETEAKFLTTLRALGLGEDGALAEKLRHEAA